MSDRKPNETAAGDAARSAEKAIGTVADAVRVATEASLAPSGRSSAVRRDPATAGKPPAAKAVSPGFDSTPAPLPAPALADAFVPAPPPAPEAAFTASGVANSEQPIPNVPVAASEAAAGLTTSITAPSTKLEKVMTTAEEMMSFQQGNFEALLKSGQIWAAGLQDLGRHWAASAQAQIDETMGTVKAMTGVKSLREAVELQSTLARTSVEKAVSEGGKLTDASLKLAEQTIAPITARLTLAAERFGRTA